MQNAKCRMQNYKTTKNSPGSKIGGDDAIFVINEEAKAEHSEPM